MIECKRCGDCCINLTLELRPPEYGYFKKEDGWEAIGYNQGNVVVIKDGPCDHLAPQTDGLSICDIYPRRPKTCRYYQCRIK